jgi:hypothetical protein
MDTKDQRIAELEDALKDRERRIAELRAEVNDQNKLITELREEIEEGDAIIARWEEVYELAPGKEPGTVTDAPLVAKHNDLVDRHGELVRGYNRLVGIIRSRVAPRPMGRPLAASKAQRERILGLRKAGRSLRWIAEETNLGLQTVRTVIDKKNGVDRTTLSHIDRIAPDLRAEETAAGAPRMRGHWRGALPLTRNAARI